MTNQDTFASTGTKTSKPVTKKPNSENFKENIAKENEYFAMEFQSSGKSELKIVEEAILKARRRFEVINKTSD